MANSISVIICCHNSSHTLPRTLAHLASQRGADDLRWEVIVIDNASTDDTAELARRVWSHEQNAPAPLRVVHEPRQGLTHARLRGFDEARHEIISFIDDDNLVSPDWVHLVAEIMSRHPEAGACGGWSDPLFEVEPPWWFENHKIMFTIGPEMPNKDQPSERDIIWGAGLAVRRQAWEELVSCGFESQLTDRQGKELVGGGDTELCLALRLCGWRLRYDPRLRLRHALAPARLTWHHLRRLHQGDGAASVGLDPYHAALFRDTPDDIPPYKSTWTWQYAATCKNMLRHPRRLMSALFFPREGDPDVLWLDHCRGRLRRLRRLRTTYNQSFAHVAQIFAARPAGRIDLTPDGDEYASGGDIAVSPPKR